MQRISVAVIQLQVACTGVSIKSREKTIVWVSDRIREKL